VRQAPSKRLQAGFDSRHPLFLNNARVDQRQIVGTTTRSSQVRSLPCALFVVLFQWFRNPASHAGNAGSSPAHDASMTPSSNGSGCKATNFAIGVQIPAESLRVMIWDQLGLQIRAAGFNSSMARSRGPGPADGERGEAAQDQRVRVPGTTPSHRSLGERPAHIRYGGSSILPGATTKLLGVWLNLVKRSVRVREIACSNHVTPTSRRAVPRVGMRSLHGR
jgi:hypothetical protein